MNINNIGEHGLFMHKPVFPLFPFFPVIGIHLFYPFKLKRFSQEILGLLSTYHVHLKHFHFDSMFTDTFTFTLVLYNIFPIYKFHVSLGPLHVSNRSRARQESFVGIIICVDYIHLSEFQNKWTSSTHFAQQHDSIARLHYILFCGDEFKTSIALIPTPIHYIPKHSLTRTYIGRRNSIDHYYIPSFSLDTSVCAVIDTSTFEFSVLLMWNITTIFEVGLVVKSKRTSETFQHRNEKIA